MPGRLLIPVGLLLCLAGCRMGPDPSVELLEGELRWMEDQLYIMEAELERKCDELATCRSEGCGPTKSSPGARGVSPAKRDRLPAPGRKPTPARRPQSAPGDGDIEDLPDNGGPGADRAGSGAASAGTGAETPSDSSGDAFDDDLDSFEPPTITIPDEGGYESTIDQAPGVGTPPQLEDDALPIPGEAGEFEQQSYQRVLTERMVDADVSHVVVTAWLPASAPWRAVSDDGLSSSPVAYAEDAHLTVVVEPRNADGRFVALPGPVTVVVLDHAQEGDAARVGRWEFDAGEARRTLRKSRKLPGLHLEIPWSEIDREPQDLHVFVRYTSVDERQLESDFALSNAKAFNAHAATWTPSVRVGRTGGSGKARPAWSPFR